MTLLLASVIDLTIILAIGLTAILLLRRRSAALRHWILAASIVTGAAAPLLEVLLPEWPMPVASLFGTAPPPLASTLRFTADAAPTVTESVAEPASATLPWTTIVVAAWMVGSFLGLLGLVIGIARLARLSAHCTPVRTGPWRESADHLAADLGLRRVDILQSANPALLVTWGLFTPKIILPAGASTWTEPRRRIVLAHEMAHIRRRDWLLHMSAEALRALYWVNPLAWLACRRLRQESEYACDDAVLSGGVAPTEYATHLLDVAREAIGHRTAWVSAPAIAHPSTLERRIAAMLTETTNREPLTRRACAAAIAGVVALALPITALAVSHATEPLAVAPDVVLVPQIAPAPAAAPTSLPPTRVAPRNRVAAAAAQQPLATISVVVQDPSGAVLPGVEARIADTERGFQYRLVTDGAGRFAVADLQPGRYEMVLSLPGFAIVTNVMSIDAGAAVRRTITMPLGSLQETLTVVCGAPAAGTGNTAGIVAMGARMPMASLFAFAQDQPLGTPVRVGGQIAVPRQLKKVNPACPRGILPIGETVVVLAARIGVDGYLNDLRHVPAAAGGAAPAQEFVDSALDAVRQWVYVPTRLNNVPVEANIEVRILYRR
jgi:beta-lactamase regulating signal transducer with metallopeptidase domain